MNITRGTTPNISFELPSGLALSDLAAAYITIVQGATTITKTIDDMAEDSSGEIYCALTQEETLSLDSNGSAQVQVRCKTDSGRALASDVIQTTVARILRDGDI